MRLTLKQKQALHPFNLLVFVLSIYVIVALIIEATTDLSAENIKLLRDIDYGISFVFFVDFLVRFFSANVGQMAFTNYLSQSIICTLFFYGYGLSQYNHLKYHQLYYVVGAIWVFQLITSAIWLRYFKFGPFEWVWRSLTYWRKQPMRRSDGAVGS